jgi:carbamate kinase
VSPSETRAESEGTSGHLRQLALELGADALLLLTGVSGIQRNCGGALAHPIHEASTREFDPADFAGRSIRPKIEATCRFVNQTGKLAAIGALSYAVAILDGHAGNRIVS